MFNIIRIVHALVKRAKMDGKAGPDVGVGIPLLIIGIFYLVLRYGVYIFIGEPIIPPSLPELIILAAYFAPAVYFTRKKVKEWSNDPSLRRMLLRTGEKAAGIAAQIHSGSSSLAEDIRMRNDGWSRDEIREYKRNKQISNNNDTEVRP